MNIAGAEVGPACPLFLIAGPCVIESRNTALETAAELKEICQRVGIPFVYKSSYDKANRTSGSSFRGPGLEQGLDILNEVRESLNVPVLTDVHTPEQVSVAAQAIDILQTPAFLCRQTDLIQAAAASGKTVNIKKGQFLAPQEMRHVVDKAREVGGEDRIMVCERGATFGYHNLVVDMRSLSIMRNTGCPVVFDATHSVQLPGAADGRSGGEREHIPVLARAAVAAGVSGLFMETHPNPDKALSDGPNAWPLNKMEDLLKTLVAIDNTVKPLEQLS